MDPKKVIVTSPTAVNQQYAASMKGGVVLKDKQKIYEDLFALSVTSPVANAKVLTNLDNAGKMNSGEGFVAYQYGIRIVKLTAGATTVLQAAELLRFLSACRLQLLINANGTKVLDVETIHFLNTISMVTEGTATADLGVSVDSSLPINSTGWLALPGELVQMFSENMNFKARLECELDDGTPTAIKDDFAFIFIIGGRRIVT